MAHNGALGGAETGRRSAMDLEFHQLDRRYEDLRLRRPERERSLLASLAEEGQQVPIVVLSHDDSYLVIDGFKRLRCLQRLGSDTVCVTIWDLEPSDALLLDRSQRCSEGLSQLEQGWLLVALRSQGLQQEELAQRVGKSVSWISRRLALVCELPVEVQNQVRSGAIPAHAAMRHLVPMARRNRPDCLLLATSIAKAGLSSREVGLLCSAFQQSNREVRQRLLENPRLFVRARAEQKKRPPAPLLVEMLRELDAMAATVRRLSDRLENAPLNQKQLSELRLASANVRSYLDTFDQETQSARQEDPDRDFDSRPKGDLTASDSQVAEDLTQHRQAGDCLPEQSTQEDHSSRESRTPSRQDPGPLRDMPGKLCESPRGVDGPRDRDSLLDSDGLLSPSSDWDAAEAAGGKVLLRAGAGDATRHLPSQS